MSKIQSVNKDKIKTIDLFQTKNIIKKSKIKKDIESCENKKDIINLSENINKKDIIQTSVVCIKRKNGIIVQDCDIYIGRSWNFGGWKLKKSKYHNPYSIKSCNGDIQLCLNKYENYLLNNKALMDGLIDLKGKTLGCFCKKNNDQSIPCHGDILVKYINKL